MKSKINEAFVEITQGSHVYIKAIDKDIFIEWDDLPETIQLRLVTLQNQHMEDVIDLLSKAPPKTSEEI